MFNRCNAWMAQINGFIHMHQNTFQTQKFDQLPITRFNNLELDAYVNMTSQILWLPALKI